MSNKESNVVLNFKMDGQVQYASTIKEINQVMNIAAKEYKAHVAAMGNDASATEKLTAAKKKLEIQLEGAQKRTQILREEYERMAKDTDVSTEALNKQYGKLVDAERAEASLSNQLDKTNQALQEQTSESMKNKNALDDLQNEQMQLETTSKKLTSEYELQKSALGENASEAEKLAVEQKHLASQMELTEKQIKNMENQLDLVKREYGENSQEAQKMETELNQAKTAFNNLGNEMDNLKNSSDVAQDGMGKLTAVISSDAMLNASEKLSEIGQKLIEIGQFSLDAFREVDDGLDTIIAKTGATGDVAESLTNSFDKIFGETVFESQSVGEAIGEVNTQFGQMDKKLEETSLAFLKFADINGSDVTASVMSAKQAMEAYRLSNEDIPMILDATTNAAQKTGKSTDDLMKTAINAAPQMDALNLSYEESVLMLGQLSQNGIDETKTMAALNKATGYYAKNNKSLSQGLGELQKKLKGAKTDQEAIAAATEVFGSKAGPAMSRAVRNNVIDLKDLSKTSEDSKDTVSRSFGEMEDPIDELTKSSHKLTEVMAPMGNIIAELLVPALNALGGLMTAINALPDPIKKIIVILGLLAVGFGAILPFVAAFAVVASTAGVTMGALALSMLPIIGIIAGIVAGITLLVTGFMWLWNNVEGFRNFWIGVWKWIQDAFTAAWNYIQPGLKAIGDTLKKFWEEYSPLLMAAVKMIGDKISSFITWLQPYWDSFWKIIGTALKATWDIIMVVIKTAIGVIGGIIDVFVGLFTGDWERMGRGIRKIWDSLWNGLGDIIKIGIDYVIRQLTNLLNVGMQIVGDIAGWFKSKFESIQDFMTNPIENAKDIIKGILDDIVGFFSGLDLSLPEIKMPKLPRLPQPHISGKFSLTDMTVPTIEWRAKGAIFTQPTIFGASGGKLQGAGDAGAEAALPLNEKTLGGIGRGIASTMGGMGAEIHLHIDTLIADDMASIDRMNKKLQIGAMKAKNMLGQR